MKATLIAPFTDVEPELAQALAAGDEIEIVEIYQQCPDLGCCEVRVTFRHPGIPDVAVGWIYMAKLQITDEEKKQ